MRRCIHIIYVTLFLVAYLIVLNINEIRLIARGEANVYKKVKQIIDNSTMHDLNKNKNLVYLFTLLKGISFIIPLALIGLILHENAIILLWTAFTIIYTVLTMFKVIDVIEGETCVKQNNYVYWLVVCGNMVVALNFIITW